MLCEMHATINPVHQGFPHLAGDPAATLRKKQKRQKIQRTNRAGRHPELLTGIFDGTALFNAWRFPTVRERPHTVKSADAPWRRALKHEIRA